jgi:hypothetical protein
MYVPLIRERVRAKGREGLFTVLRADYFQQRADLIGDSSRDKLTGIPFAALFATFENPDADDEDSSLRNPVGHRDARPARTPRL